MKHKTLIGAILLIAWIAIWINFMARDLIKRGNLHDYKALIVRDATGKKSYTYGDYLFDFLNFCKEALPGSSDYSLVGVEKFSLRERRAVYYLYPNIKKEKASFLLVFNEPGFKRKGYVLYKKLDNFRFILKRI